MEDTITKHPQLTVLQKDPFNGGPPLELLRQSFVTPQDLFYVRSHGNIPLIDGARYRLSVNGAVERELSLSLDELRSGFTRETRMATLHCAGNRRREMLPAIDPTTAVLWGSEGISNALWGGVRLRDLLAAAGTTAASEHVAFVGLDEITKDGQSFGFGGSIPLEKALADEVLLAYEMNGEPLQPVHGYPLRVVVPGFVAARSVKWLAEITLQAEPSTNYFQARDYKIFPPEVDGESVDWEKGQMLGELGLNSVICAPGEGQSLAPGRLTVTGYAITGGEGGIESVEVSADGGHTWVEAALADERHAWAWRFWQAEVGPLAAGSHELVVRAHGADGSVQPADLKQIWNFRGYMNNAWHRVRLIVE
jgi:sulfite oxidase